STCRSRWTAGSATVMTVIVAMSVTCTLPSRRNAFAAPRLSRPIVPELAHAEALLVTGIPLSVQGGQRLRGGVAEPAGLGVRAAEHAHALHHHEQEPGQGARVLVGGDLALGPRPGQRRGQRGLHGVPARLDF